MDDKSKLRPSSIFSSNAKEEVSPVEVYKVVVRKEGRRKVFDVYEVKNETERKCWEGLSTAGIRDSFEQIGQAD
jgi:hypothetical protein